MVREECLKPKAGHGCQMSCERVEKGTSAPFGGGEIAESFTQWAGGLEPSLK